MLLNENRINFKENHYFIEDNFNNTKVTLILNILEDKKLIFIEDLLKNIDSINKSELILILNILAKKDLVIKISSDFFITKNNFEIIVNSIKTLLLEKKQINIAEIKEILLTSRKYTIPLLEYLDKIKITKRIGDFRSLY
ncbi:MAG: SelB C-terminal domain-containing protein [Candidatus Sericytochromatia bacterium]